MSTFRFILILASCLWLLGCGDAQTPNPLEVDHSDKVTIRQGIWGNVFFYDGNFFPGAPTGTITLVQRTVYVFEPVGLDDVVHAVSRYSAFYHDIRTTLVDSTRSNKDGFFQLSLPPGQYSVFIREDSLFYGGIGNPVGVSSDSVTKVRLNITHSASF